MTARGLRALKVLFFLAALGPLTWLVWAALTGNLSANPLSDLTNEPSLNLHIIGVGDRAQRFERREAKRLKLEHLVVAAVQSQRPTS